MKNRSGGRLSSWRSRACSKHGARRTTGAQAAQSPAASGAGQRAPRDTGASLSMPRAAAADPVVPGEIAADRLAVGEVLADAMELAIGLLTASLDSPQLEAWAAVALTPVDVDGLGNFMAGLHVISELLLDEVHEATGEPPEAILQRLAIVAEQRRGTPSPG
jgi:hypothetical protein